MSVGTMESRLSSLHSEKTWPSTEETDVTPSVPLEQHRQETVSKPSSDSFRENGDIWASREHSGGVERGNGRDQ